MRRSNCLQSEDWVGEGVEDDVVRTVSEDATALKFDHASFEKE